MSNKPSADSSSILWKGKPWIAPGLAARTVAVFVLGILVLWLEFAFHFADRSLLGLTLATWTALVVVLIFVLGSVHLLLIRASNTYILRNDSLEIKTGILTTQSFIIAASGFADMEVRKSVSGRIVNVGTIIIRSQGETSPDRKMFGVINPDHVADQIRQVMAVPAVRIVGREPPPKE